MLPEIDAVLARAGGVATRRRLLQVVTRHQFDHEVRTGHLAVPFRGAFCRPWNADFLQDRAALVSVGPPAALSHLTAIHRWQVWHAPAEAVQLVVPAARCPRPRPGIQLHRVATMPPLLRVDGLPTVDLPHALVQSWPLLPSHDRRAPVIEAVRRHLTTRAALAATLRVTTRLPHRAEFDELLRLLDDGCESELEIWGYLDVFDFPGLRHGTRQLWVETPAGRFRTDLGYEAERVAIELDGAATTRRASSASATCAATPRSRRSTGSPCGSRITGCTTTCPAADATRWRPWPHADVRREAATSPPRRVTPWLLQRKSSGQADFSRRSRLGGSRGTSVG